MDDTTEAALRAEIAALAEMLGLVMALSKQTGGGDSPDGQWSSLFREAEKRMMSRFGDEVPESLRSAISIGRSGIASRF